jgi:hypothetical protein
MNRREMLTGMAVAGATVALSAPTIAKDRPVSRAAWDKAMGDLQRAKAASDAYDAPFWRIDEAYRAAIAKVPHATVEGGGYGRPLTTADRDVVVYARNSCKSLRYVETCAYADAKARQEFVDLADARDAQIELIDRRVGWTAANEHYEALTDVIVAAEEVLLSMPAPDGEALLWKVNRLYPEGEGIWEAGYESQTQADLRRLLSSGRV